MNWKYNGNKTRIILENPPRKTKAITGHRFSSVLGLNKYQTNFGAWCEIVGLVKLPFEDNKYTIAGKTIEPKQIDYARKKFPNVMNMEEYYGNSINDYRYSNYKDLNRIFDGVRDFVCTKNDKRTITLVGECKTSSKPQDWSNQNVPQDYLCQNMLYTYLDKLDKMMFVASFLNDMDYNHPEQYVVDDNNTILVVKKLSDCVVELPHEEPSTSDEYEGDWTTNDVRYGGIEDCVEYCEDWWITFVKTGISPKFDEKLDKEYLDIIRASKPTEDNDLITVCSEAIQLAKDIKELEVSSGLKAKKDELKVLEACIKDKMIKDEIYSCNNYTLKQSTKKVFNEEMFAKENEKLYNKYVDDKISYTLNKNIKEEKTDGEN